MSKACAPTLRQHGLEHFSILSPPPMNPAAARIVSANASHTMFLGAGWSHPMAHSGGALSLAFAGKRETHSPRRTWGIPCNDEPGKQNK